MWGRAPSPVQAGRSPAASRGRTTLDSTKPAHGLDSCPSPLPRHNCKFLLARSTNPFPSYNPRRYNLIRQGESSNNGSASGPTTILARHGVRMPRSSSAPLSLSKLSTLTLFLLLSSFLLPSNAFAQGSKRKSLYDPIEENDKDRPDKRAEWLMRGRVAPKGQSAAALRLRAHQQKMAMRAARQAVAAKAGRSTTSATATAGWVPLGPAPLVSDQSFYGDVSGRVTAIAVDPSDTTGNTVYAAGASGGVWKSTNAAGTLANVTWTPVTDQQASLTNGAVSVKSDGGVVVVRVWDSASLPEVRRHPTPWSRAVRILSKATRKISPATLMDSICRPTRARPGHTRPPLTVVPPFPPPMSSTTRRQESFSPRCATTASTARRMAPVGPASPTSPTRSL